MLYVHTVVNCGRGRKKGKSGHHQRATAASLLHKDLELRRPLNREQCNPSLPFNFDSLVMSHEPKYSFNML